MLYATGESTSTTHAALFTLDTATGSAAEVGPSGAGHFIGTGGLAYIASTDTLYALGQNTINPSGATTSELFSVNPATGATAPIGWTGPAGLLGDGGLAYSATTGTLYATGQNNSAGPSGISTLYVVDPTTGAASVTGATGADSNLASGGLAFAPGTNLLYGTGNRSGVPDSGTLFGINPDAGTAAAVGLTGGLYSLDSGGLAIHPITGVAYASGVALGTSGQYDSFLFTIDLNTGTATLIGPTGGFVGFGGLAFVPVPEPASVLLFTAMVLGAFRNCRRSDR